MNQAEENVQEGDGAADDVRVVEFDLLVRVRAVLHGLSEGFQPFRSLSGGRRGQRSSVNGHAQVHVVVVHQYATLVFGEHLPGGKDGVEGKGWIAKRPGFVDAHHRQVFDRHGHSTVHHFIVFNRHLTGAVVVGDRALKDR